MDPETRARNRLEQMLLDESAEPTDLPLSLLTAITDNFSDDQKIGSGEYAVVYKGVLRNGTVAVKKFKEYMDEDDRIFIQEVRCLMRAKHKNIIRFFGYCAHAQGELANYEGSYIIADNIRHRLLCFEYVPGGSLHNYITDVSLGLEWRMRYQIIRGICEGLNYLHEMHIVHFDLKPDKILLDHNMVPKICDSRFFNPNESRHMTNFLPNLSPYIAPEIFNGGEITFKFDIYALGVIITEILTGQKQYSSVVNQTQEHSSVVQQGTLKISGVESSEIELNILELILAGSEEPMHIDFMLLQSVTENFSEKQKVGVGGCGEVYKGILQNGVVVVKRLFKTRTIKDKMFHREVKSLITARHENIVRFLGYCSVTEERALTFGEETIMFDIRERLLCFEYIRNGSLDNYLTDELRGLEWHTRYEIVVGICKGLLYLHKKGIIHMDLKPANILLDDRMVPKITDFGLSRLDNNSQTTTTSRLVSPGYCAPEYLLEGKSSRKSDMYSYGVLINELMTGTKKMPNITKILRRWKHRWITSSKHTALGYQQVTKCLELAQRCMQIDPNGRPDISDIIDELNEIDSKDDQFQVIPCLEDMLGIEPLEIQFPFEEHDQQISHSVELINDTDDYFAFITKTSLCCLHTEPDKGIVTPRSKCNITVTMMQDQVISLQSNRYKEKITVLSTRADGGLAVTDITRDMFIEKEGKVVDEVDMTVLFGMPPSAEES